MRDYRVGVGYDIHRLVAGRPLVLGGVVLAFEKGLAGHSDGDVLLHAVIDALAGGCNLPDIGDTFPDTDPKYEDADSKTLLADMVKRVRAAGFVCNNVDCIVHAEKPKLSAHKRKMAETIASLIGIDVDRVSVKAKTAEGLGPCGTSDAIAATAVVCVTKKSVVKAS